MKTHAKKLSKEELQRLATSRQKLLYMEPHIQSWTPNPDNLQLIEYMASRGESQKSIAALVGSTYTLFSQRKKMFPEIQDAIDKGRGEGASSLMGRIWNFIEDENTPDNIRYNAIRDLLTRSFGWREKNGIEELNEQSDLSADDINFIKRRY